MAFSMLIDMDLRLSFVCSSVIEPGELGNEIQYKCKMCASTRRQHEASGGIEGSRQETDRWGPGYG